MEDTEKEVKIIEALEVLNKEPLLDPTPKSGCSIEGRVISLCLSTYYFGYSFA